MKNETYEGIKEGAKLIIEIITILAAGFIFGYIKGTSTFDSQIDYLKQHGTLNLIEKNNDNTTNQIAQLDLSEYEMKIDANYLILTNVSKYKASRLSYKIKFSQMMDKPIYDSENNISGWWYVVYLREDGKWETLETSDGLSWEIYE